MVDDLVHFPLKLLLGFEPRTSSLPRKRSTTELQQQDAPSIQKRAFVPPRVLKPACPEPKAGEGIRTLNIQLGRLELCQLSYTRTSKSLVIPSGQGGIRTPVGLSPSDLQSDAIGRSATCPSPPSIAEATEGNRTLNLRFTKPMLCLIELR